MMYHAAFHKGLCRAVTSVQYCSRTATHAVAVDVPHLGLQRTWKNWHSRQCRFAYAPCRSCWCHVWGYYGRERG